MAAADADGGTVVTGGTPLRVLLVHVWYWPHVGGGDQHVEMLGRELVKLGHQVTVCAPMYQHTIQGAFHEAGSMWYA